MGMNVNKALLLCRMRQRSANKAAGRVAYQGLTTKKELSRRIWPNSDKSDVYMSGLISGARKSLPRESIEILCHELGVDPNFLFEFPSLRHDEEFLKLLQER